MKTSGGVEFALNEGGLTFVDTAANMGVRALGLRLPVEGRAVDVRYGPPSKRVAIWLPRARWTPDSPCGRRSRQRTD